MLLFASWFLSRLRAWKAESTKFTGWPYQTWSQMVGIYLCITDNRTWKYSNLPHHNPCCILDTLEIESTEIQNI